MSHALLPVLHCRPYTSLSRGIRAHGFLAKAAAAAALVACADLLFFEPFRNEEAAGSISAGFCGLLLAALIVTRPAVRRDRRSRAALVLAGMLSLAIAIEPSLLAVVLLWAALALAALLPHAAVFGHAWTWTHRVIRFTATGWLVVIADALRLLRLVLRRGASPVRPFLRAAIVPAGGLIVFLGLFAAANPVMAELLGWLEPTALLSSLEVGRLMLWTASFVGVWTLLRPNIRIRPHAARDGSLSVWERPGRAATLLTPGSLLLSLTVFNAAFALQNGLDLAYLWSGLDLPAGMTHAEYAHRGAYPLIVTALLAAVFVLVALEPGAGSAIRRLVTLWIGQNLLLVLSSILRTLDYVDAYSLTLLRLSALIWMGLVGVGLVLICVRIHREYSAAWLINANALAVLLVLVGACSADLSGFVAGYNVRHAAAVTGRGQALDVWYLRRLGPAALPALRWYDREVGADGAPDGLRRVIACLEAELVRQQRDWRRWTVRGEALLPEAPVPPASPGP